MKYEAAAPESLVERAALIAKAYPGVREVQFGYPTITYYDIDGTARKHQFDFTSVSQHEHRVAVSVACSDDSERRLAPLIELLNRQGLRGRDADGSTGRLANFARVWTARETSPKMVEISRAIVLSRMNAEDADVKALNQLIKDVSRPFRLSKLVEAAERPDVRRHSVWRLVDEGILTVFPNEYGEIDHITVTGS